ncbi:MAG: HlyD family efflux transporter periplasmic adaptor subunit [Gemmatimonadetes bacterium]|nr:HlyD family efflux transporter periplasmic adaptor subunit [Gemmatimonadota bacterium]
MDIPRQPRGNRRRYVVGGGIAGAIALTTIAIGNLKPAAPTVDKATVWMDTVKRGPMVRQVRGPGTLVPEQIQWIPAVTAGRVERILVRPGEAVTPETVLLELSNPEVQLESLEAQQRLAAAEADLVSQGAALQSQVLDQQGVVAMTHADEKEAQRAAASDSDLVERQLIAANDARRTAERAEAVATRLDIERKRLDVLTRALDANLALQRNQVERLRSISDFQAGQVRSMRVTAAAEGVLQELPLEVGQWVSPGATLAKVAQPGRLKAVLRIPETQAKDVVLGQTASIDTRNGLVAGRVFRIDPAVQNGTVTVEVALEGPLPRGARPDLSVDGTIEIERLKDVLYVGRPTFGQANSSVGLFKLVQGTDEAVRVNVALGRSSVNTVEVVGGLEKGDRVILSDMSQWDSVDRVRLK